MDSFFDILIGFVIVYSLLSPLFKKKKKPIEVDTDSYEVETDYEPVDDKSIAEEISILFGEKPKTEKAQPQPFEAQSYSSSHPKKKFEKKVYSEDEKNYSHLEKTKRIVSYKEQKRIDELASSFLSQQSSESQQTGKNEMREKLISIFHSPENIKEYILFAEVFGKPKALRR